MTFRCGDRVRERDGRHTGRVVAVFSTVLIRVRWDGTGWLSDVASEELERDTDG